MVILELKKEILQYHLREGTMKEKYCEKYDHENPGTEYVFDDFYDTLYEIGMKSNLVAACGENIGRYIGYADKIAGHSSAKIVFMENDKERHARLQTCFDELFSDHIIYKRTQILLGDIFTYDSAQDIILKKASRLEDLGIGIRYDKLMPWAMARLGRQLTGTGSHNKFKAQMIDGSRKRVSEESCIMWLQMYLNVIGAELKSINGIPVKNADAYWIFRNGEQVATYVDELNKNRTCRVYSHSVKFKRTGRLVMLKLFSYINGGSMFSSLLVYR
jgi:hypothetical protein